MRMHRVFFSLCVAAVAVLSTPSAAAKSPPQTSWSVRVCPQAEVATVALRVGVAGESNVLSRSDWTTLTTSDHVVQAAAPKQILGASAVWLDFSVQGNVDVCVLHGDVVAGELFLTDSEAHEFSINQSGDCAC